MQQTRTKGVQDVAWLGGKGEPLGIVQKLKFDHTNKWHQLKPESVLKNETHEILWDFEVQTNQSIPVRRTRHPVDFVVPQIDYILKMKEDEKLEKYLDLARELEKLWNMKVTVMWLIFGALGTISKGFEKRLMELETRGRNALIQTTALVRFAGILRRVLETWKYSDFTPMWKTR